MNLFPHGHWMDCEIDADKRLEKREAWDRRDWAITIGFLVVFPPIGIAALWRRLVYRRVWHNDII